MMMIMIVCGDDLRSIRQCLIIMSVVLIDYQLSYACAQIIVIISSSNPKSKPKILLNLLTPIKPLNWPNLIVRTNAEQNREIPRISLAAFVLLTLSMVNANIHVRTDAQQTVLYTRIEKLRFLCIFRALFFASIFCFC